MLPRLPAWSLLLFSQAGRRSPRDAGSSTLSPACPPLAWASASASRPAETQSSGPARLLLTAGRIVRPGLRESLDSLLGDPLNLRKGQDDGWGSGKGLLGVGWAVNEHQGFLGKEREAGPGTALYT